MASLRQEVKALQESMFLPLAPWEQGPSAVAGKESTKPTKCTRKGSAKALERKVLLLCMLEPSSVGSHQAADLYMCRHETWSVLTPTKILLVKLPT